MQTFGYLPSMLPGAAAPNGDLISGHSKMAVFGDTMKKRLVQRLRCWSGDLGISLCPATDFLRDLNKSLSHPVPQFLLCKIVCSTSQGLCEGKY